MERHHHTAQSGVSGGTAPQSEEMEAGLREGSSRTRLIGNGISISFENQIELIGYETSYPYR